MKYLNNDISKEELIEIIKRQTRRYAKRQLTWFKSNKDIIWLDGQESINNNINFILTNL